jgi:hypothetical protein
MALYAFSFAAWTYAYSRGTVGVEPSDRYRLLGYGVRGISARGKQNVRDLRICQTRLLMLLGSLSDHDAPAHLKLRFCPC